MIKKIFQTAFLPTLVTAFFVAILVISRASGSIFFHDEWIHKGILIFLEILVWLSGGWLFNRLLGLLFWDLLVGMYTEHHPPKMLVQISGILFFPHAIFHSSLCV